MELSGSHFKLIGSALIEAFDYDGFERLLREELDQRLDLIASRYVGFAAVVWATVLWAEQARRVDALVAAAKRAVPDNQLVQALPETAAAMAAATAGAQPFLAYAKQIVAELSGDRYQIDRRFVRLTLLVNRGAEAPDAQRSKYDHLRTLLGEIDERAAVLLGGPGSGKTTLLRRLQLEYAWEELEGAHAAVAFYISLNGYRPAAPDKPLPDPLDWLAEQWRLRLPGLPDFRELHRHGRVLLLLDGLNEIPHIDKADYRARLGRWQAFLRQTHGYGNTVVFGCRTLEYSAPLSSEEAAVRQVDVEPLSPKQMQAFLHVYLGERGAGVWDTLRRDERQIRLFSAPFFLRLLVDEVAQTGRVPGGRAALLTGFVRRTLLREIERGQRLFHPNGLLSEDDVRQVMLDRWTSPTDLPGDGALVPGLERLAYDMQAGRPSSERGQVRLAERVARAWPGLQQAPDVMAAGLQLNVLDKDLATREVMFFHQLVQEYFAARRLARHPEPQRVQTAWRAAEMPEPLAQTVAGLAVSDPLPGAPTTGWEETTLLAAAMTAEPERFVADLIPANLPLAARCAAAPDVAVSPALVERLQQQLLARMGDAQTDLRARSAAAEALGELGDPRFERRAGPHGAYLRPLLVPIAGGTYVLGDDAGQYDDEKPAHTVEVAPFELAAFPVTNAEYRLFVEAGGYKDERWWQTAAARACLRGESSNAAWKADYWERIIQPVRRMTAAQVRALPDITPDDLEQLLWFQTADDAEIEQALDRSNPSGRKLRQPEYWEDGRFNHPAQPVVGVTWFEARAYCAWLAAQTGWQVDLPTEAQWEAAARGARLAAETTPQRGGRGRPAWPAGRRYAWGPDHAAGLGNTFETHIRRTTPVGVFPDGRTPEGLYDLSGNVWEWTRSQYRPYRYDSADGREDPEDGEALRTLRGGSWSYSSVRARASYRNYDRPYHRSNYLGFRVVCVVRPPSHQALAGR